MKILQQSIKDIMAMTRRGVISLVLCVAMLLELLCMIPVYAMASETASDDQTEETESGEALFSGSVITANRFEGAATTSSVDYEYTVVNNAYMLRVTTGVSAGDNVVYLAVAYKDTNNIIRRHFIFPGNGAMKESMRTASSLVDENPAEKKYNLMTGYASKLESNPMSASSKGLRSYSTDDYLFCPTYKVSSIIGIDVMMREGKSNWTCLGMQLYAVDKLAGYDMYGYYSRDLFLDFTGILVAEVPMPDSGTVTYSAESGTDELIQIRTGNHKSAVNSTLLEMKTIPTNDADRQAVTVCSSEQYMMKIDVADVVNAGIETIAQKSYSGVDKLKDMTYIFDALTLKLSYTDSQNGKHTVRIPAVLSMVCYLIESGLGEQSLFEIAQHGDSIVFPLNLPGFNGEKPEVSFYYGTSNIKTQCGVDTDSGAADEDDGTFALAGFQIFSKVGQVGIRDHKLILDLGTPQWYFTATSANGFSLDEKNTAATTFSDALYKEYQSGARLTPVSTETVNYLVEMETYDVALAGTKDDIYIELLYTSSSTSSAVHSYGPINVREKVEEFYGYWPTRGGEGAYGLGACGGGTLRFFVEINNVYQFTGMRLYVAAKRSGTTETTAEGLADTNTKAELMAGATDDYQMNKIIINDVVSRGDREFEFLGKDINADDGIDTCWEITRNYTSQDTEVVNLERPTLVQPGEIKEILFGSTSEPVTVNDVDVDWSKYDTEGFTYEDSLEYMGYTKKRVSYKITAKVADDSTSTTETGDAGSNNHFYFQLVYENGKTSGYVLANQLIESGKFRSAQEETFTISMNYDYGEIAAVRVIPDDVIEEGEEFDKLHLEYIKVERLENAGINPVWQCNVSTVDNGWIGIDYQDPGAQNTSTGQAGRNEGSVARTYTVDSSSFSVSFLMMIKTEGYNLGAGEEEREGTFEGTLFADIHYVNSAGMEKIESVDVFAAMATYLNLPQTTAPAALNVSGKSGTFIDKDTMLLSGGVNWFEFSLDDLGADGITGIDFRGASQKVTTWYLSSLQIHRNLSGDGELLLDSTGNYVRNYQPQLMAETSARYSMYMPENEASQKLAIPIECPIEIDDIKNKWSSRVGKEPASIGDKLNVYAYMLKPEETDKTIPTSIDDYNMYFRVEYSATDNNGVVTKNGLTNEVRAMDRKSSDYVFYATGVDVSGIIGIDRVVLAAKDGNNPELSANSNVKSYVKYMVIEQVRSGVVMESYYVLFGGSGNANGVALLTGTPTARNRSDGEKQTVYLRLGDGTDPFTVKADSNDIKVAITYRTNDMIAEGTYASKNIFLSDLGYNNKKLKAGDVISVNFTEQNLATVSGIRISKVGDGNINISNAAIRLLDADGECTACLGSNSVMDLQVEQRLITVNAGDVTPLALKITTADVDATVNSGCNGAIKMVVNYRDAAGSSIKYEVADITKLVSKGCFDAGGTAEFTLLVPGLVTLDSLEFTPYDSENNVANTITWKPMLISGELLGVTQGANRNADKVERIINQVYYEDKTYTVNLKTIQLSATVQTATATLTVTDNDPAELVVASGSAVTISPTVAGSSKGVTVGAVEISGGVETKANSVFDSLDGPQYVFRAPENKGTSDKIYKITVTAQENTDKKLTITIRVPGQDVSVAANVRITVGNGTMDPQDLGITSQSGSGTYEVLIPDLDLTDSTMYPITVKLSVVDGASSFALNSKSDVSCALYRSSAYDATSGFSQISTDSLTVDYAGGVKVGITLKLDSKDNKGAYQLVLTSVEDATKKFVLTVRVANVTEPSSSTE